MKVVKLKIKGKIDGKFYRGTCEASAIPRTDFRHSCRHQTVYRIHVDTLPPALKKATLAKAKRERVDANRFFCVCLCDSEVIR